MAAKLIQKFKSQISWYTAVNVLQGEHGYFFTMGKAKKNKETGKYDETPFLDARDVAALILSAQQALAFIDANPLPREGAKESSGEFIPAPEYVAPKAKQPPAIPHPDDEIPF